MKIMFEYFSQRIRTHNKADLWLENRHMTQSKLKCVMGNTLTAFLYNILQKQASRLTGWL